MDKQEYLDLDFSKAPRIPHRLIWILGPVFLQVLLWQFLPGQIVRWLLFPLVIILGWVASFGWKEALRALRFWLDQVIGDKLR